jgi:hypothetical protein
MEGTSQFVVWRHITEQLKTQFSDYLLVKANRNTTVADHFTALNQTIYTIFSMFPLSGGKATASYDKVFKELQYFNLTAYPDVSLDELTEASDIITTVLFKAIIDSYGFASPENETEPESIETLSEAYFAIFQLVFGESSDLPPPNHSQFGLRELSNNLT